MTFTPLRWYAACALGSLAFANSCVSSAQRSTAKLDHVRVLVLPLNWIVAAQCAFLDLRGGDCPACLANLSARP